MIHLSLLCWLEEWKYDVAHHFLTFFEKLLQFTELTPKPPCYWQGGYFADNCQSASPFVSPCSRQCQSCVTCANTVSLARRTFVVYAR